MEENKVEYVPAIGREPTNLFMMFSLNNPTCSPSGELVLEFRKCNERKGIHPEEYHSSKHSPTPKLERAFCPFFKEICKEVPTSPDYCQNISLLTKSRKTFVLL